MASKKTAASKSASTKLAQKAKKSTKPVTAAKTDVFALTAASVEKLTEQEAHKEVVQLVEHIETGYFRLGGILSLIQEKKWFEGFDSFKDLVQDKFGLHYRKATYLIEIYRNLIEKQIPWSEVKGLSWTKLKEISKVLTPKNVTGWVKKANSMTVIQLMEAVKQSAKAGAGSDAVNITTPEVSVMQFKVHGDQKKVIRTALDKVKKETKTDFDTVALFNLSQGYLGKSVTVTVEEKVTPAPKGKAAEKAPAVPTNEAERQKFVIKLMREMGHVAVFECVDKAFPKLEVEVVVPE